ncbi:hypothetical protein ACFFSY_07355 [Paenibacillus aurantiacus]|uniref:Sulfite exporter TauE/SafE family protein n=1 Tax=Paenibacillus aurantiacus TaxID=1936118 RepID=A0ABV5KLF5_9BACL
MPEIALLVLLGLIASVFGSIVGLGGGIILVPSLTLLRERLTGAAQVPPFGRELGPVVRRLGRNFALWEAYSSKSFTSV